MKKVNALVLGLAVLLAVGCDGEKVRDEVLPQENFTHCRITKTRNGTNEAVFLYDNAGRIVQMRTAQVYYVYEYNALGKVSRVISISGTDTLKIQGYEYNPDSLVSGITYFNNVNSQNITEVTFSYDAQKRLVAKFILDSTQPGTILYKNFYKYIAPNKVLMESFLYNYNTNAWEKQDDTEYTFDGKKNPYSNASGFAITISYNQFLWGNEVSSVTTQYAGGVPTNTFTSTTLHTYNSAGYPTESIQTSGRSTMVYKYEYDCQ